jgi:hypothetical protein
MSRHGWYFTIVSNPESAIEYVVVYINNDFDRYVREMRTAAQTLESMFGVASTPSISVEYPDVALLKVISSHDPEALEEAIDNSTGRWGRLPLQPLKELLHSSGALSTADVFKLLRESEVEGSTARLRMDDRNFCLDINPTDSSERFDADYFDINLLPV